MRKKSRFGAWILIYLTAALLFTGCKNETPMEEAGLKITFFDVGKGDAILIETEHSSMLIDAGYDDTASTILDYLKDQGRAELDCLVLTHFDKDHIGGADRVLEAVKVKRILQPDYESDSGQYLEYQEALKTAALQPETVTESLFLSFDGADCLIYPPQKQKYEEEDNDFSLVISMTYGQRRFFFAGDSEKERIDELLEQTEFDLQHDLLKVPHHGKKEKNSEDFLEAVSPKAAVITCSAEEPGDDKIRRILRQEGAQVYMTSEGTVTCVSDGEQMEIRQQSP